MNNIEEKELRETVGGEITVWGVIGIGALVAFISGVIDGIARPTKCH